MEGLNFEEQQTYHPTERVKPIPEMPVLAQGEIKDIRSSVEEMKRNDKKNPHWDSINPNELTIEDLYAYKMAYLQGDNKWASDDCKEFTDYSEKMEKYVRAKHGNDVYKKSNDSRYNLYAFLRNYLVGEVGLRRSAEKKKEKEKNKVETIH